MIVSCSRKRRCCTNDRQYGVSAPLHSNYCAKHFRIQINIRRSLLRGMLVPSGMILWPKIHEAELRGMHPLRESDRSPGDCGRFYKNIEYFDAQIAQRRMLFDLLDNRSVKIGGEG